MTELNSAQRSQAGTARDKIKSLSELGQIASDARSAGRKVVLCHGVFDLLHMGHVRHFEAAKAEGDMVIVTLTADRFVNKGPGRPIFSEQLRAEMVAAVGYVDWVGISTFPSAETVLNTVKPDVYLKGSDYENPEDDITGKIDAEREVVEEHGGKLVFTKDITFSSSSLINRYLDVYDPPLQDCLNKLREEDAGREINKLLERVSNMRVLFVGDAIIDEYQYVLPLGKSAKENMIATKFQSMEQFAGGVFAAANHTASICKDIEIITALGDADNFDELIRRSLKPNVKLDSLALPGRPTTRKSRFVESGYMRKLFELYQMDDSLYPAHLVEELNTRVLAKAKDFDLVIVTDFGHGLITQSTVDALTSASKFLAINAQTNSGNQGYNLITKYPRADYICIDAPEARLAVADRYSDIADIASQILPSQVSCDRLVITHGGHGCYTFEQDRGVVRIPAFTRSVVDTVGAGDAFFAITAPLVAAGGRMDHVGFVGNAAGAIKVGILGHRKSVERVALLRFISTLLK